MEKTSTNTEGQEQMFSAASELDLARSYIGHIGGPGPVKRVLARAYGALAAINPDEWTERRVRALWNGEAAGVRFREMIELHRVAEREVAERERLALARKEHADFVEKTARLRALLEHQDEDFHRPQIEGMGRVVGGVDRTGTD